MTNEKKILEIYRSIYDQGVEPKIFLNDFLEILYYFKNIESLKIARAVGLAVVLRLLWSRRASAAFPARFSQSWLFALRFRAVLVDTLKTGRFGVATR